MENDPHDLEAQAALAREFQPNLEGPLVGEKRSSHAITEEYAKADPIYVAKTIALPEAYSHYRPIVGDGSCGWRAIAFAYLETLIRLGDKDRLISEATRMTSFNNFLIRVGGYGDVVLDMVEETIDLLKDLASQLDVPGAAQKTLLARMNDLMISNYIVYHLRFLAASQLRSNPAEYENFIPGVGFNEYCKTVLEPVHEEIDNVGMKLLIDVLLKPIGISVVIAHLDLSPGSQVNHHQWPADETRGVQEPIIYLLFRPTHYDILYKDPPLPLQLHVPAQPASIQVNRASFTSPLHVASSNSAITNFSSLDLSDLISLPGFGTLPSRSYSLPYHTQLGQPYSPALATSVSPMSPPVDPIAMARPLDTDLRHSFVADTSLPGSLAAASPMSPPPEFATINPPIPFHHASEDRRGSTTSSESPTASFRPSKYEWEAAAEWQDGPTPNFTTSTFKNSHYNTAHYNNPNFQPEEWSP